MFHLVHARSRGVRRAHHALAALAVSLFASLALSASAHAVWTPSPDTTWQWQIVGEVREPFLPVDMYDIDLQDAVPAATTITVPGFGTVRYPAGENAGVIDRLHAAGKTVICYLDSGAWERYRPDAALFPGTPGWKSGDPASDVILRNTGWAGENWLDIRPAQWSKFAPIIWARFDLAAQIGCDGVEPDQNNPFGNNPGPRITKADQKAWYLEVARQAHARNLSVGMKNGVETTDAQTAAAFDWNLNEECLYYEECDTLSPFVDAGKAVFLTEYTDDWAQDNPAYADPVTLAAHVCPQAQAEGFSTLVKNLEPDELFVHCW